MQFSTLLCTLDSLQRWKAGNGPGLACMGTRRYIFSLDVLNQLYYNRSWNTNQNIFNISTVNFLALHVCTGKIDTKLVTYICSIKLCLINFLMISIHWICHYSLINFYLPCRCVETAVPGPTAIIHGWHWSSPCSLALAWWPVPLPSTSVSLLR